MEEKIYQFYALSEGDTHKSIVILELLQLQ